MSTPFVTAAELDLAPCTACGAVCRRADARAGLHCPRCHAPLRVRKPASLARTWALLATSAILYLPANLLPIMETRKLFETHADTILSGIVRLWTSGSIDIAIIVFVASFVVPLTKILMLAILAGSVQLRSTWAQRQRGQLYRAIEFVGYWSMLDVFVVALLAALVQLKAVAEVHPLPGAAAFAGVVLATMLASMSFDPRLIWDAGDEGADASTGGAAGAGHG